MFGNRVRHLRQSGGLNQQQLGEKLGVTKQSVSNWENDNIMPSVEMLEKVADYFSVSTDYLLGRDSGEFDGPLVLDITGLTPQQAEHVRLLVDDLRDNKLPKEPLSAKPK